MHKKKNTLQKVRFQFCSACRIPLYTGLVISSSGISELDCATTKTDTAERSVSIGREALKVFLY